MGPMETTTQALNLEQTSVQGLKPEGHHPRFEFWPMALKIPSWCWGSSPAPQPVSSSELGSVCLSSGLKFSSTNHQLTSLLASNQPKPTQPAHPEPLRDTQAPHGIALALREGSEPAVGLTCDAGLTVRDVVGLTSNAGLTVASDPNTIIPTCTSAEVGGHWSDIGWPKRSELGLLS
ncbi:uncharacterized protein PGTG_05034 [Puccinia graminis f. sp. tritici CRL 75-36-700-3]|uniref:Uncharacterized protein n=1 Tax=Puccinia graminis f. sp. tritici (strain CRL 75-36-700-3 / race SCCL) TaxID=418459 RepID=E3K3M1_PUCGT|nr:uncharacterized protein PGTG_05034 [Puccinia graminis f. sp. tritici CRL 75-36-700-3]EFP79078.1 hypothetical protein PGTG_05034 [Puccinia graminis f. sp. tritici CRL 75-36-700-3]